MKINTTIVNEKEQGDIVCDCPDDCIQTEKVEDNQLKIVVTEDDQNVEADQNEIEPSERTNPVEEENEFEKLDTLIEQLPEHFPAAAETIKNEIAPLLIHCDSGIKDHYIKDIKKKTNAASIKSVTLLIDEANEKGNSEKAIPDEDEAEEIQTDPEITALAEQIAQDPMLFKNKIDLVNQLGVVNERKNIGLNFLVIDSRLLPMKRGVSEALALKNSGQQGAGKSYPLLLCLELYPKSAYHLINNGSDKSLYNIDGGLKHKAFILNEALALEYSSRGDNELAKSIRNLISEGHLKYQYTGFINKEKVTIVKKMEGPTSFLTTTIAAKLEKQLEDRLITMHPNTSNRQIHNILERTAELASGYLETVDDKIISAWKQFNKSLVPVGVVVPFSTDIASFLSRNKSLPTSINRAFPRVFSAIKTIALLYQKQRSKDDLGRVIAEISDYAIAVQLINDSFLESIGAGKRYTDKRIKIIEKDGVISSKDLAKAAGVSVAAISQWTKPMVKKKVLMWVDPDGGVFPDDKALEKAKRSGKAYIKVSQFKRLPTPFELTGNPDWDIEGELYRRYDLGFESSTETDVLNIDKGDRSSSFLNTFADINDADNKKETEDSTEGDKVLSSIPHKNVMKTVSEVKENQEECDPNDPETVNLFDEFSSFLSKDSIGTIN